MYRPKDLPPWRLLVLLALSFALSALAFEKPSHPSIEEIDKRTSGRKNQPRNTRQAAAAQRLQSRIPNAKADFHPLHGSPHWIRKPSGFLTVADPAVAAAMVPVDSAVPIKRFVTEHSDLFGHDAAPLSAAYLKRQSTNSQNGVRTFAWEQRLDDIPVYGSVFAGHVTAEGELISLSSTFMPDTDQAADAGTPNRLFLEANPPLSVEDAIIAAAESIGQTVDAASLEALDLLPNGAFKRQRFFSPPIPGQIDARLVWVPMNASEMRLCWQIELTRRMGGERYRVLIDVQTGEVLLLRRLTVYVSPATFRVFTGDSPSPFSPGWLTPSTNQPPTVSRELVTLTALFTNASPLGWINEGENQTRGNNVDAHLDRNGDDLPDLPRPHGSPDRVFDLPLDLGQSPYTYGDAAVVQLFYWCNWMHDQLYQLGFDEASGNYQKDNFGRGGAGNDPVLADAQDGSGFNNANFTPSPDGESPRVQMYVFNGPNPARDGDLDAEIMLHELTHGLSTRLVGAGVGIDALQTEGMGEGWSDFFALSLLGQPGDDLNGAYAMGGYVTYQLSGLLQNYYYGIRRYPYSTDMSKNPLTFKDIDPSRTTGHPGVPTNPINPFNALFVDEVHAQGEVWFVTLWEARANLIRKYGFAAGNRLILQLVTDGMKLAPANPNFLQARDAILLADEIDNSAANFEELWSAFAKRGMGFSASAPSSGVTVGVVEAFDMPDALSIVPSARFLSSGPVGGPFLPGCMTYLVTNRSSNVVRWSVAPAQPWLNLSATHGQLAPHGGTNLVVCIATNATSLNPGVFRDTLVLSNATTRATQSRGVDLRVMQIAQMPFSDGFETGKLEPYWLSTGTGDFRTGVTATDQPHSGIFHVTLDSFGSGNYARNELTLGIDLAGYTNVTLRFWARSFNDESDGPPPIPFRDGADFDGVAISQDGIFWYEVQELQSVPLTNREYVVLLDQAVTRYGLSYNSTFRIRFNHYDNFGIPFDGFALDDISVTGIPVYRLSVAGPAHVSENSGVLPDSATVTLAAPAPFDLVVQLASSDPNRLRVPSSVRIPAGSLSASFNLTAVNDTLLNASSPVTISAAASGYYALSKVIIVDDDETATLRLRIPTRAREGDGTLRKQGSVRLSRKADADLRISLSSSDPLVVAVPAFIVVRAGANSTIFDLQIGDDQNLTGPRTVRVTAHVENWIDGAADILIADNETAALALKVPARLSEGNGTLTNVALVQLSGIVRTNVQVNLASRSPAQLQVPASVIVPAGKTAAAFDVTVFDDAIVNGLRTISITATAPGFASGTASIGLIDDETAPVPYQPSPPNGARGIAVSTNLSWHPGFGEILVNGGFETGDFTGWQLENSDYGTFIINDGKVDPEGPENPTPPYDGKFSLVTSQIGSGKHVLYQDIFIPDEARSARLSWVDMIRNYATDFVPFTTEFRVEIRDTVNNVLATIFVTKPGDQLTNVWTRRSFDISQFRGQSIRVAFIEQDLTSYFNLHLDDISVFLGTSGTPSFDLYFGTSSSLRAADLKGSTTNAFWPLPQLALNTTYYWQIMEHLGPTTSRGPLWRFTTRGVGPIDHFDWTAIPGTQELNRPFPVTLTARDDIGNIATNFSGPVQLSAISGPTTASAIVVTEIDTGSNDSVEFQNVSGRAIDISNWKMTLWDGRSWPAPRVTVTIPTNTICPADRIFQLFRAGTAPGTFPVFYTGLTLFWNNNVVGNNLAVLLRDSNDNIVDFVCAYGADPADIKDPLTIPRGQWLGDSIPASNDGLLTLQRIGQVDHNNATDWLAKTNSIGRRNNDLLLPFRPLNPIPLTPSAPSAASGIWTGQITLQQVASNLTLLAADGAGHVGFSSRINVTVQNDLALDLAYSPDLTIPGNQISYLLTIRNSGPQASTGVLLTNHPPGSAQFVSAAPSQGQCGLLNGILFCSLGTLDPGSNATLNVVVSSTAPGPLTNVFGVTRNEPETYFSNNLATAVSTVDLPLIAINDVTVNEGNSGTVDARLTVRLSAPSTLPVAVSFTTSNRTATAGLDYLATSGLIVFPPGSTNQPLVVKILGDLLHEANETFEVDLFSPTNAAIIDPVGVVRISDDDATPSLRIGDATVVEPAPGAVTNALFNVTLSAPSGLPVSFSFVTSNGTAIAEKDYLPQFGQLTIDAGATNARILVPVFGDRAAESSEFFFVNVYAPLNAFTLGGPARCTILDNGFSELDHFSVSGWPSPQYAGVPFVASVTAKDGRNNNFTSFSGRVSVKAVLPQPDVLIGASTSLWAHPFGTLYHDSRTQVIYLSDELGGPGNLSGLSLFVGTPPGQTLSNWTIRLKHTALNQYLKPAWEGTGWTYVYQNNETIFTTGWVTFLLSAPFAYDGINNLMVDFSFNNSSYSSDALVRYHSAAADRTAWFQTDSAFGDPLNWAGPSSPPPSATNAVPNLRFLRENPAAITPALSGDFVNGVWTDLVTVSQPGTNVILRVSDGANHFGSSEPFIVESALASNHDGLPDSWKARYFAPGASDSGANDDPDHDGFTNLQEFQAGTDPHNPNSAIRISSVGSTNGGVRLQFDTALGKAYRLERADDPAGPWSALVDLIVGTGGAVQLVDYGAASQARHFYRVRLLP